MRPLLVVVALVGLPNLVGAACGCAAAPPTRAVTVRPGTPSQAAPRLVYPLINADGARFVWVDRGSWEEGVAGRRVEYSGEGFHFLVAPTRAVPPGLPESFTLLTESGPCEVSRGDVVVVERRHDDPEMEDFYGIETALAVELPDGECGEAGFAYASGRSTTLTFFDLDEAEFEQPQHGRAPSLDLTCVITHPPSEDGICPGFPPTLVIRSAAAEIFHAEMPDWVFEIGILDVAGQRYVVADGFYGFNVFTLTGERVESAQHVGAVDVAQTCD